MLQEKDLKNGIKPSITTFMNGALTTNALSLFSTLGYNTNRQSPFSEKTYHFFKESFLDGNTRFDETKALVLEWKYVDLLFQLSKDEIAPQLGLFDTKKVDNTIIETYLFFVIELSHDHYSRTALSQITRELNKVFPMPVMVLFKYGQSLTLAVINRRLHKRDESKDVMEKITLIKDINIKNPHRAHIEILFDLSFSELLRKHKFANFVELHNAWQKTLDTKELNKQFYQELFNWYLWASKNVRFPQIGPDENIINDKVHQNESLIRLLTRLLFCWFMKEKGLINPELFDENKLKDILKDFEGKNGNETIYYKAILQNLFFATLNKPIDQRKVIDEGYNPKEYGDPLVYRFVELFQTPQTFLNHFECIPFLNGGLFECLDQKKDKDNPIEIRLDGFSTKKQKQAHVPDFLFWGEHKGIDLSEELDNPQKKEETVRGIIDILNSYKFTIEENTPIEEDIALDPELLGRVFENLLASYNPETQTTARKQTGSFYTPREIVNYMVDESLKAYLKQKMVGQTFLSANNNTVESVGQTFLSVNNPQTNCQTGMSVLPTSSSCQTGMSDLLSDLISYSDNPNPFNDEETLSLINAIDNCKILDPACGSGAFPMGILHKLVHILHKLDPENKQWFEKVIVKFPAYLQHEMRNKLKHENWDYLRKLGILQECIYGVDIQPIAIQIAKLRFFISMLVDQDIKGNAQNNFGLMPLPNLDFKLVAANTLIGVPEQNQHTDLLIQDEFFDKFNTITEKYFTAYEPEEKKKLIKKIKELVNSKVQEKLAQINRLSIHEDERFSKHLAEKNKAVIEQRKNEAKLWESYNNLFKHKSVEFFDIKYFFPEVKDGFDVVIGNPPYVQIQKFSGKQEQKDWENQNYRTFAKTGDIYCLFYEKGNMLLRDGGILAYITSNKWMRANYGEATRRYFVENTNPLKIIDFGGYKVFESATVDTNILILKKAPQASSLKKIACNYDAYGTSACSIGKDFTEDTDIAKYFSAKAITLNNFSEASWIIASRDEQKIKEKIEKIGTPLKEWDVSIYRGVLTGFNEAFIIDGKKKDELIAKDAKNAEIIKPILRGRDIKRYRAEFADLWLINTHNGYFDDDLQKNIPPIDINNYPVIKEHLDNHWDKIEKRQDMGVTPYNLRSCAYFKEFEKEKIVYPETTQGAYFFYDKKGSIYVEKTAFLLVGMSLCYLTALLGSSLVTFTYKKHYSGTNLSDKGYQYNKHAIVNLPIPKISPESQQPFIALVSRILSLKKSDPQADTSELEAEIDRLVYNLYGLTEEEIKIIERKE